MRIRCGYGAASWVAGVLALPQASGDIGLEDLFFPMFPVFEGPIFAGIAPGGGCQAVQQGGGLLGNLTDFLSCVWSLNPPADSVDKWVQRVAGRG